MRALGGGIMSTQAVMEINELVRNTHHVRPHIGKTIKKL